MSETETENATGSERAAGAGDAAAFKSKRGLARVWRAATYSRDGFFVALRHENAFRQELCVALPAAVLAVALHFFWLCLTWGEVAVLLVAPAVVLTVELLNSAVETCVDYISTERHPLAKRAKDMGSAAVTGAIIIAVLLWLAVLLPKIPALSAP
jgi:diacylglycerol kinase (ATP)